MLYLDFHGDRHGQWKKILANTLLGLTSILASYPAVGFHIPHTNQHWLANNWTEMDPIVPPTPISYSIPCAWRKIDIFQWSFGRDEHPLCAFDSLMKWRERAKGTYYLALYEAIKFITHRNHKWSNGDDKEQRYESCVRAHSDHGLTELFIIPNNGD